MPRISLLSYLRVRANYGCSTKSSRESGTGGSSDAAQWPLYQRVDGILPSLRMIRVFLQICEHSSEARARQEAETPPSLDH
jgi:hypothetical protein